MAGPPSPALLRLREADIVRLCGLASAGDGLRLADRHALRDCRRRAGRLGAKVEAGGAPRETWVEVSEIGPGLGFAWTCWCAPGTLDGQSGESGESGQREPHAPTVPACAHVAAILTTWLREPVVFTEDGSEQDHADPPPAISEHHVKPHRGKAPPTSRRIDARPARDGAQHKTLRDALAYLATAKRESIAQTVLGDAATSLATDDLIGRLLEALADPERVIRGLENLDAAARALLWAVLRRGGSVTGGELDGLAERHRGGPGTVTSARRQLESWGMLFRSDTHADESHLADQARTPVSARAGNISVWYVPVELARPLDQASTREHVSWGAPLRALPSATPLGPPSFATHLAATENRLAGAERAWVRRAPVRQLYLAAALLTYLATKAPAIDGPRLSRKSSGSHSARGALGVPLPALPGDLPPTELAAWAGRTHLPVKMMRMAWRLGHGGGGAPSCAPSLDALARLPAVEWPHALRDVFRRWLETESYAELTDLTLAEQQVHARCDPHHEGLRRGALGAENAAARRFIVETVGQLRVGTWYAMDDVLDLIWWVHPWFLRGRQRVFSSPAWWLAGAENERPLRARIQEEWRRAEGQYITYLLTGPLHWWGVLDVGGVGEEAPRAVRLTTLGAYLLARVQTAPDLVRRLGSGWGPAALPTRDGRGWPGLAVQPCAATPALLDALGVWARVIGPAGDRLLWYFSGDLVCRAFDAGCDPETLLTQLRAADERDHTRVARDIAQLVATWRANYGASRIELGVALLEAVDAPTLREALALAPEIAARSRLISATCALVPADLAATLTNMLDRRGFVV